MLVSGMAINMSKRNKFYLNSNSIFFTCFTFFYFFGNMHFRSLSTNLVPRAQAAVSHQSGWSYVSGPGSPPLLGLTVGQVVDRAAEIYGDREGLVVSHQHIRRTFSQIRDEAEALAAGFLELGMEPGDRVGIWGPNTHQWYVTQFAAAKAGLVLVNINPAYQAGELHYCLNKVGVKCLVAADSFKTQDYHKMLREIMPELETSAPGSLASKAVPSLKNVVMMSDKEHSGTFRYTE